MIILSDGTQKMVARQISLGAGLTLSETSDGLPLLVASGSGITQAQADARYAFLNGTNATGLWPISISGTAASAAAVPWNGVGSPPTTLAGYGLTTDFNSNGDARWAQLSAAANVFSGYQEMLAANNAWAIATRVTGDTTGRRFVLTVNGEQRWGPGGAAAADVVLGRSGAGLLALTTGSFDIGNVAGIPAAPLRVGGDIQVSGVIYATDFVLVGSTGGTGGTGGGGVIIQDEGTTLAAGATVDTLNFVGAGISSAVAGGVATITVTATGTGAVSSVFGRTGDVVAAVGDYTWVQISGKPTTFAPSAHTHVWADITHPTTIGGYGITDFNSLGDARWLLKSGDTLTGTLTSRTIIVQPGYALLGPGNGAGFIQARNAANTAYLDLLYMDASDRAQIPRNLFVNGTMQSVNAIFAGNSNPYVQFNDGSYLAYWQMTGGTMQLFHNGAARANFQADGSILFFGPVTLNNLLQTQGNGINLNAGIVGYGQEVFTARGASVPHYGWRWTTTTDIPGDNNVRLLGGGYGGISLFTAGIERLRMDVGGAIHWYAGMDSTSGLSLLGNLSVRGGVITVDFAADGVSPAIQSWSSKTLYINQQGNAVSVGGDTTFSNNITTGGRVHANGGFYSIANYGIGMVGLYDPTKYRSIYAMGDAYKMATDGSALGSLYGLFYAYDGVGGKTVTPYALGHGFGMAENGVVKFYAGAGGAYATVGLYAGGGGVWGSQGWQRSVMIGNGGNVVYGYGTATGTDRFGLGASGGTLYLMAMSDDTGSTAGFYVASGGRTSWTFNVPLTAPRHVLSTNGAYFIGVDSTNTSRFQGATQWTTMQFATTNGVRGSLYCDDSGFGILNAGGSWALRVAGDGSVNMQAYGTITGPDFVLSSDLRLKSDLQAIPSALTKLDKLTGYTYRMKSSPERRRAGLIAQDVREVLPEAVIEDADGMLSLSYDALIPLLVEAIKELRQELREVRDAI